MNNKTKGFKVIQTRIPLDTVPVLDRYLEARFISYNGLINQLLHERLFGVTDTTAAKDAVKAEKDNG